MKRWIVLVLFMMLATNLVAFETTFASVKKPKTDKKTAAKIVQKSTEACDTLLCKTADLMPQFQGGSLKKFIVWMEGQLVYPADLAIARIPIRIFATFVVEKDGSLSSIRTSSSPNELFSQEAMRVLNTSPRWRPGEQNGKKVRVPFMVPVNFK